MTPREIYRSSDALALAELVRRREIQPRELLEAAIGEVEATNPTLNAVVIEAFEQARDLADSLPASAPLAGVPFLLKDLHLQWRSVPTTNGCRLFRDHVGDHDSELVKRYIAAGLVPFGRSASPELGLTTSTESVLWGQTRNPWNLEHAAGGSSGGAAAAVAAGMVPVAHASDGGGSIRVPASCCGLFGLKPTRARISMAPDAGEGWNGLSTHHVVSRTVRDSAALLDLTHGPAAGDPYVAPPPPRPYSDEVGADPGVLRIALQTETFNGAPTSPECVEAAQSAARLCEELGHRVEEATFATDRESLAGAIRTIIQASVRAALDERAANLGREVTQEDVESATWGMYQQAESETAADYAKAIKVIHRVGREWARFLEGRDLLLTPTMATPPPRLGVLALEGADPETYLPCLLQTIGYTQLMNVTGAPAMSVPLHWSSGGLPIGVQFAAPFGAEGLLYRLAAQLEEARPWAERRPPAAP